MTSCGYPPMPPPAPTPGRPRRRWRWSVVAATLAALLGAGLSLTGLVAYANADHLGILDDPPVVDTARAACARAATEVRAAAPPAGATRAQRAAAVRAQDAAAQRLVATMERLGRSRLDGDEPAQGWLTDWRTLIALREAYAASLDAGGDPRLAVPQVDGVPISYRMADLVECPVVDTLWRPS